MRIIKRPEVCAPCTASLWFIPSMTYFIMKMNGIIAPSKEWVWWVGIPVIFLIWVLLNWKIETKK